jgi:hypothetical protein
MATIARIHTHLQCTHGRSNSSMGDPGTYGIMKLWLCSTRLGYRAYDKQQAAQAAGCYIRAG